MSVSPSQNSSKPSPVPGPSTVDVDVGVLVLEAPRRRPTEMGSTVDEPETTTSPRGFAASPASPRRGVVVVVAARSGDHADAEDDGKPRHTAAVLG